MKHPNMFGNDRRSKLVRLILGIGSAQGEGLAGTSEAARFASRRNGAMASPEIRTSLNRVAHGGDC
jgi:hypothetical protein